MKSIKGIIFDMDNTILRSNIDFAAMKRETFHFLTSHQLVPEDINLDQHTTSMLIEKAASNEKMTDQLNHQIWDIVKKHEVAGMTDAGLEPGVVELLDELRDRYLLAIVTNNSVDAAEKALRDNKVRDAFDAVVGREMMKSLKPAPDGFYYILHKYEEIFADEWICVGDLWIDGKASIAAGISFVSCQGDHEMMTRMGVEPAAEINDIRELLDVLKEKFE